VDGDGIPRVKIKIGESWGTREGRNLARARLARDTVGDAVELYVDANGGYSVGQAVRMGRAFDDLGVTWFEEPVSSDDLAGLRQVRSQIAADVAAGEYAWSLVEAQRLCAAHAVDCLQADATRCGGYTEWLRIAAVAAAVTNLRHVEWFHDHVRIEHVLLDGAPDAKDGAMVPDLTTPGHGVTLSGSAQYRTG
jgi:L-alanine-DL-glutamate epimerase-like enolase superfamily enzyme